MQKFLEELPALIITVAVLAMITLIILIERLNINDTLALTGAIASPAISFWFIRGAAIWQPVPLQGVSAPQEKAS